MRTLRTLAILLAIAASGAIASTTQPTGSQTPSVMPGDPIPLCGLRVCPANPVGQ